MRELSREANQYRGNVRSEVREHIYEPGWEKLVTTGAAAKTFGEEAAANSIRFNDLVLVPAGFPGTTESLEKAGYNLREIPNTEAAKLDGGMSCLSLRFTPPG